MSRDLLIGVWRLSDCKMFDEDGNEQFDPFHDGSGLLIYHEQGVMSVQVMKAEHAALAKANLFADSAENFKQAFENYVAYYGNYSVNEEQSTVTHSVVSALWPSALGKKLVRQFEFIDDNTLILSTAEPEAFVDEAPFMRYLTWSREAA